MSNLLLFLLLLACLGISASWIAENPGEVVIHWGDWRIDTSLALIFGAVLAASLAFIITYSILAKILNLPSAWSQNRSLKSYKNGLTELTWTVASLAASDIATAERHAKKAQKLLGNSPMTLLLFAQISRHQGDEGRTQHLLEEMLEHKETEYLAARMLSESAHKQEMLPRALALAQRAQSASPHDGDAVVALVSLNVKMQQWQKALDAVNSAGRKAGMSSGERSHLRGVILLAEALSLAEDEHDETALAIAKKSLKYLPDFAPAVMLVAKCYHEQGKTAKGVNLLLHAWNNAPHPHIAEMLRTLTIGDAPKKRDKIMQKLGSALLNEQTLWRCGTCGDPANHWHAHCPACGAFDSLESGL